MKRVVFVQPYLPEYRVALFERVVLGLARYDIKAEVATGQPDAAMKLRGDERHGLPWQQEVGLRQIQLGPLSARWYDSEAVTRGADAVVVELAAGCLDSYRALARCKTTVGVWGHVGAYTGRESSIEAALRRWQMRRARHLFAYTDGGAKTARLAGVAEADITVMKNATDTGALIHAITQLTEDDVSGFRRAHGLGAAPVAAFIGGLDRAKRLDFLAEALDELWASAPEVKVLVGGSGPDAVLLNDAAARGQVRMIGYADPRVKALIAKTCSLLLCPGRVGLVAVDSLAMAVPVATTTWPYHAPEFEYLVPGKTCLVTADDPEDYARDVERALYDQSWVDREAMRLELSDLSVEAAADRIVGGVIRMLAGVER